MRPVVQKQVFGRPISRNGAIIQCPISRCDSHFIMSINMLVGTFVSTHRTTTKAVDQPPRCCREIYCPFPK